MWPALSAVKKRGYNYFRVQADNFLQFSAYVRILLINARVFNKAEKYLFKKKLYLDFWEEKKMSSKNKQI